MSKPLRIWEEIIADAAWEPDPERRLDLESELEVALDKRDRELLCARLKIPENSDIASLIARACQAIRDNKENIRDFRAEVLKTHALQEHRDAILRKTM